MREPDYYFHYHRKANGKLVKTKVKNSHKDNLALNQAIPAEQKIAAVKKQANELLAITDWTQVQDCALPENKKEEYKAYRAAVRHIRSNAESLFDNLKWPEPPAK